LASTRRWAMTCLPCSTSIRAPIERIFYTNGYDDARWGNGRGPRRLRYILERRVEMRYTPQRTTCLLWWLMVLLCCVPMAGRGSDAKGNYVTLGFGLEPCQTFLQARSNGLDLPYRHWLTGYLTAVNKLTKDTVDIRGTTDIDGMLGLLERYCIQHPSHSFSRAVESLVREFYQSAGRTCHPHHEGMPERCIGCVVLCATARNEGSEAGDTEHGTTLRHHPMTMGAEHSVSVCMATRGRRGERRLIEKSMTCVRRGEAMAVHACDIIDRLSPHPPE